MRILHTSDWHLGRLFHNVRLTSDQAHVLSQFVDLARSARPDVVIVAGDVYDRAVPPPDAVELLDQVLTELAVDVGVPVLMIAGNHDGGERLGFGARLLARHGVHVAGLPRAPDPVVRLYDAHGPVDFALMPFAAPEAVRDVFDSPGVRGHEMATALRVDHVVPTMTAPRRVGVGHAFVVGGAESESERTLAVGGGTVPAAVYAPFHFTALGHLHEPQTLEERVHYCGSLLAYSFGEADRPRSVSLVELGPVGELRIESVPLTPQRAVRRLRGTLAEVLRAGESDPTPGDYVEVELTDPGLVYNAMAKLRTVYPNALHVRRSVVEAAVSTRGPARDHRHLDPIELFDGFWREVKGEGLDEGRRDVVSDVVRFLVDGERAP